MVEMADTGRLIPGSCSGTSYQHYQGIPLMFTHACTCVGVACSQKNFYAEIRIITRHVNITCNFDGLHVTIINNFLLLLLLLL